MFVKGSRADAAELFEIIKRRIVWMDENGIDQWNNHDYLSVFPLEHYIRKADEGRLYVLKEKAGVICGAVLDDSDPRWDDGAKAIYVHNFASEIGRPGAGRKMLEYIEGLAKDKGCDYIRLDCDAENDRLNAYYDSFGFISLDRFEEGVYRGVKKQKEL